MATAVIAVALVILDRHVKQVSLEHIQLILLIEGKCNMQHLRIFMNDLLAPQLNTYCLEDQAYFL